MDKEPIRCCDGCGATVQDETEANTKGWQPLFVTGRWRCYACWRALSWAALGGSL